MNSRRARNKVCVDYLDELELPRVGVDIEGIEERIIPWIG